MRMGYGRGEGAKDKQREVSSDCGKGGKYPDFFLAVVTLSPLHYRLHRDRTLSPILSLHSGCCRVEVTSCFLAAFATLQFLYKS